MTAFLSMFAFGIMMITEAAAKEPKLSQQPKAIQQELPYARPECPARSTLEGLVSDGKGGTINLNLAEAEVWMTHKIDIDEYEDQCINEVYIKSMVQKRGCEFLMVFQAQPSRNELVLVRAELKADSFCPGWPDEKEGLYRWIGGDDAPTLLMSRLKVPDRTADRSCVDMNFKVAGKLPTTEVNRFGGVDFALEAIEINGTFDSVGDTEGICPSVNLPKQSKPPKSKIEKEGFDVEFSGAFASGGINVLIQSDDASTYLAYGAGRSPLFSGYFGYRFKSNVELGVSTNRASNSDYIVQDPDASIEIPTHFNFTALTGRYHFIHQAQFQMYTSIGYGVRLFRDSPSPAVKINPFFSPVLGLGLSTDLGAGIYLGLEDSLILQPKMTESNPLSNPEAFISEGSTQVNLLRFLIGIRF